MEHTAGSNASVSLEPAVMQLMGAAVVLPVIVECSVTKVCTVMYHVAVTVLQQNLYDLLGLLLGVAD